MITQLTQFFKTTLEQQKAQWKLNLVMPRFKKSDYVKVSIPKTFISMVYVLAAWGIRNDGQLTRIMIVANNNQLPIGYPTHTKDITGRQVCVGDKVVYDYKGESNGYFIVVFEENAFRKKYPKWDPKLGYPLLEFGEQAINMRLKVVKK
ncbi:MAG TPA: hypothetical protein VI413_09035 [Paludibacter sp.]